jgi:hypothetical protein
MTKKPDSKTEKVITKIVKALIIVLGVFIILISIVFIGAQFYFGVPVIDYYKASEREMKIPGLADNLVPQGFDYIESEEVFLVGGYQKDGAPSRVYRIDRQSGKSTGYVVLGDSEGNGVSPHAGGLAVHGDYLFVAGDEDASLYIYNLSDVLSSGSGTVIKMVDEFRTTYRNDKINVAFLCFTEDSLIVGEFYRVPNYVTDESHWITTPSGDENHALAYCYPLSDGEDSVCGVGRTPSEIYSLPGLVQGMTVQDGKIWISQSYGTAKSTICSYDISGAEPVHFRGFIYSGRAESSELIPVYALDSSTLVSSFEAPPMAEEIIFVDGKLLIMCESASNKYFFGNLTGGQWCYATDITKLV